MKLSEMVRENNKKKEEIIRRMEKLIKEGSPGNLCVSSFAQDHEEELKKLWSMIKPML